MRKIRTMPVMIQSSEVKLKKNARLKQGHLVAITRYGARRAKKRDKGIIGVVDGGRIIAGGVVEVKLSTKLP